VIWRVGALVIACLVATLGAVAAPAETRREESVGVAPIRDDETAPRDAALHAAVRSAVLRVAAELLPADFIPPEPATRPDGEAEAPGDWLAERLGDDPFAYVSSFRILEDRGRRPAMFAGDPDVEHEYVVVADVSVDVGALRDRVASLGLLAPRSGASGRELRLVIEGLTHYLPLAMLRETLQEDRGVRSVVPVEFTAGRAVLAVKADRDATALVADLSRRAPEGLKIVPVDQGPDEATLLVEWRPPAPPDAASDGPEDGSD